MHSGLELPFLKGVFLPSKIPDIQDTIQQCNQTLLQWPHLEEFHFSNIIRGWKQQEQGRNTVIHVLFLKLLVSSCLFILKEWLLPFCLFHGDKLAYSASRLMATAQVGKGRSKEQERRNGLQIRKTKLSLKSLAHSAYLSLAGTVSHGHPQLQGCSYSASTYGLAFDVSLHLCH